MRSCDSQSGDQGSCAACRSQVRLPCSPPQRCHRTPQGGGDLIKKQTNANQSTPQGRGGGMAHCCVWCAIGKPSPLALERDLGRSWRWPATCVPVSNGRGAIPESYTCIGQSIRRGVVFTETEPLVCRGGWGLVGCFEKG